MSVEFVTVSRISPVSSVAFSQCVSRVSRLHTSTQVGEIKCNKKCKGSNVTLAGNTKRQHHSACVKCHSTRQSASQAPDCHTSNVFGKQFKWVEKDSTVVCAKEIGLPWKKTRVKNGMVVHMSPEELNRDYKSSCRRSLQLTHGMAQPGFCTGNVAILSLSLSLSLQS